MPPSLPAAIAITSTTLLHLREANMPDLNLLQILCISQPANIALEDLRLPTLHMRIHALPPHDRDERFTLVLGPGYRHLLVHPAARVTLCRAPDRVRELRQVGFELGHVCAGVVGREVDLQHLCDGRGDVAERSGGRVWREVRVREDRSAVEQRGELLHECRVGVALHELVVLGYGIPIDEEMAGAWRLDARAEV